MPTDSGTGGGPGKHRNSPRDHSRHFSVEHLSADIGRRSARGGVVTLAGQGTKFVLQMGSTMVLARLLTPADFGLVAMVAFFTGLIGLFRDLGLAAATVQRREVSHSQVSTLFWVNVLASTLLALLGMALAPLVAWFYGEPELVWITIAISATFVFGGLSAQHIALLRRQMRYVGLAGIEIGAMVFGIIVAVGVALAGGGYWALVAMTAGQALATAVLAFVISGWRPGAGRFDRDVGEMFSFGAGLTGANMLNYFTRNSDNLLLGRFWGAAELGVYSRAYALLLMPMQQINGPIAAVAIPALSRLQSEPERFRGYYLKVVRLIAYASMPLVVLLAVLAEEAVLVLLGPQWLEAALLFQIFAAFVAVQNVASSTGWVMHALGQSTRMLKWSAIQAPVFVIACLLGLPWGATGVATAATTQGVLIVVPAMLFAYRFSPVRTGEVLTAIARPMLLSLGLLMLTATVAMLLDAHSATVRVAGVLATAGLLALAVLALSTRVRQDVSGFARLLRRQPAAAD